MFSNLIVVICSYICNSKSANYEKLYAVATFLAPLQSNLLSDPEKKIAREYLKTEVKKMEENDEVTTSRNNNTQRDEGGDDHDDAEEEEDTGVYIPGAGLLAKLNARDLRRIDKETEFDKRFESLLFTSLHYFLFRFSSDLDKVK